jgi:hypothetical protein
MRNMLNRQAGASRSPEAALWKHKYKAGSFSISPQALPPAQDDLTKMSGILTRHAYDACQS